MAWLRIDGHAALAGKDPIINTLVKVIDARLLIHGEVFLTINCGMVRDIVQFHITRDSRVTHPESIDNSGDDETYKVIGSDSETRSPQITYDAATKTFEPWNASQMW